MTKIEVLGISSGMGALNLIKNIRRIGENEVLQFSKRAYTSKYPAVNIPPSLSTSAKKRLQTHIQNIINVRQSEPPVDTPSDVDKDADKFVGKSDYEEKINVVGE